MTVDPSTAIHNIPVQPQAVTEATVPTELLTSSPAYSPAYSHAKTERPPLKWIHFVGDPLPWSESEAIQKLGGKGYSLCRLIKAGYSVPAAFIIRTEACEFYHSHGRQWPEALWPEVQAAITRLERATGQIFGSSNRPLLLAVRSGAAVSMPGLMTTILNCGLCESIVRAIDNDQTWTDFTQLLTALVPHTSVNRSIEQQSSNTNFGTARAICEALLDATSRTTDGLGTDDSEQLLQRAISSVLDSWKSSAIDRFLEGHPGERIYGTAVTVQVMFPAEVAGIVFSRNPKSLTANEIIVEAVAGTGQALVGGQVTPTQWCIPGERLAHPTKRPLADHSLATELNSAMFEFQLRGLHRICDAARKIESLFSSPVDIEFGYRTGELTYFQARPIAKSNGDSLRNQVIKQEQDQLALFLRQGRTVWMRHNLSESLPAPTPLTWGLWREFMRGSGGYGVLQRRLGCRPSKVVRQEGFLELIAGRIYADPLRQREMVCHAYPVTVDLPKIKFPSHSSIVHRTPRYFRLKWLDPWFLLKWPYVTVVLIRSERKRMRLRKSAAAEFDHQTVPRLRSYVVTEREVVLHELSLSELINTFERRRQMAFDQFAPLTLLPGTLGAEVWAKLEHSLTPVFEPQLRQQVLLKLAAAIPNPVAIRQHEVFMGLAAGQLTLADACVELGHRGPREMDLATPRWRETPAELMAAASQYARAPHTVSPETTQADAEQFLRRKLEENGCRCLTREIAPLFRQAMQLVPYRELGKHEFLRTYELIRDVLQELSKRLNSESGIHFLTLSQVLALQPDFDLNQVAEVQRQIHRLRQQLYVPELLEISRQSFDFRRPDVVDLPSPFLRGTPLTTGQGQGRIHFLTEHSNVGSFPDDAVVVAATIDPGQIPMLQHVAAMLVEQGGMLSHVALLARQFSLPMLVVPQVTELVQTNELVHVDADRGLVEFQERS